MKNNVFRRVSRIAVAAVAVLSIGALAACGSTNKASSGADTAKTDSSKPVEIVASINQWGSVASLLGGKNVHVTTIMNSTNVEAHDYEPTAKDIAQFKDAKIIVVNGADYDAWASKASEGTKAEVVNAAKEAGIKDGDNPHVWFSAKVRNMVADAITKDLKKLDPQHAQAYDMNNKKWHEREDSLEKQIEGVKKSLSGVDYAATESVAYYLGKDLGMNDATPQGYASASANESEPTPSDITEFQDALKAHKVKLLVFNTQEADDVSAKLTGAAKDAGIPIVKLTEQMPSKYHDLIDWMHALVGEFGSAVKK